MPQSRDAEVGERVVTSRQGQRLEGTLRYVGTIGDREWAGIELDQPVGLNNGTAKGHQYFSCADNHGLFVPVQFVACAAPTVSANG